MKRYFYFMLIAALTLNFSACSKGDDSPRVLQQQTGDSDKDDGSPGSGYVKTTCTSCNGNGQCPTCHGSGKGCETCNGTGKYCAHCGGAGTCRTCYGSTNCQRCYGTGQERCTYCGGTGNCFLCHGAGKNYHAGLGWTNCTACSGSGNCSHCRGTGKEKCIRCYGNGRCDVCNGKGTCYLCDGNPICGTCGGDGHCTTCKNHDGVCVTCEGKGFVWTLPDNNGGNSSGSAQGTGTLSNPFNVAAAIKKCKEIGSTVSSESYYVKGIVEVTSVVDKYGNASCNLVDAEGDTEAISVYRAKGPDGKKLKVGSKILRGAVVLICGPLCNYVDKTPEIEMGNIISVDGQAPELEGDGSGDGMCCPDNNHPHKIDLGLPSGTKWACCNVDATYPEESGGLYAWGETQTKSMYSWDTYLYGNSKDDVVDIGLDISGTSYDVAHVKWGSRWKMPTHEQYQELYNNTTSQLTTQNGVKGCWLVSANGNSIFLPVEPYANFAFYGSSTLYSASYPYLIRMFYFNCDKVGEGYGPNNNTHRSEGTLIRPVWK